MAARAIYGQIEGSWRKTSAEATKWDEELNRSDRANSIENKSAHKGVAETERAKRSRRKRPATLFHTPGCRAHLPVKNDHSHRAIQTMKTH